MQDLIKESASEFEKKFHNEDSFDSSSPLHINYQNGGIGKMLIDILDWHTKQMEKAYNKGREQNNRDLELWLLRLHNEPELWTVAQALKNLTQT